MPQSQTEANPRLQEEEKKDENIHAQNKQTSVRKTQRPAPSSPSEEIRMLKQTEKQERRAREDLITLSAPLYNPQSYTDHKQIKNNFNPPKVTFRFFCTDF